MLTLLTSMPLPTQKTVWKSAAIPREVHQDALTVSALEVRHMGDVLGEILAPILRQRLKAALRKNYGVDLKLKRQARNGKTK